LLTMYGLRLINRLNLTRMR